MIVVARTLAAAGLACAAVSGCGGAARTTAVPGTQTEGSTANIPLTASTSTPGPLHKQEPVAKRKRKRSPGSLPQTDRRPSATTRVFRAEMASLWKGVIRNSVGAALPAFFPEDAYAQVKAIADPAADFRGRLLFDYRLDLGAAHALLGASPGSARLLEVNLPAGYAHWVSPGACYNRVGYYEVPNARVVYRQDGNVRSFGIASMISWRGVWYVVHLGAVLRTAVVGVVDDPSVGSGESAPSTTC
jgi:hypothetical protein